MNDVCAVELLESLREFEGDRLCVIGGQVTTSLMNVFLEVAFRAFKDKGDLVALPHNFDHLRNMQSILPVKLLVDLRFPLQSTPLG